MSAASSNGRSARASPPRSSTSRPQVEADVVIIDRVGVLGELYALADMAFVGGGFHSAGLHSVLEPASFGAPVLFGPRNDNSRDAALLVQRGGGAAVAIRDGVGASTATVVDGRRGAARSRQLCARAGAQWHRGRRTILRAHREARCRSAALISIAEGKRHSSRQRQSVASVRCTTVAVAAARLDDSSAFSGRSPADHQKRPGYETDVREQSPNWSDVRKLLRAARDVEALPAATCLDDLASTISSRNVQCTSDRARDIGLPEERCP